MKIAYVTGDDPHSITGWSGLTYFIGKALENAGNKMSYVNSFAVKTGLVLKLKQKIYPKFTGKFIQPNRYPYVINQYTKQISGKLNLLEKPDFLFSNSSELVAAAEASIPKAFWVDASFAGMIGYYPEFSILHPETIKVANQLEQQAYDKADLIFFASEWAAETALENYTIDDRKVKVVPFGANLLNSPVLTDVKKFNDVKSNSICHLLFIGVYWERKGGLVAVKVAKELIKAGINTKLTIVGCSPYGKDDIPPFVEQTGFLSKDDPIQKQHLEALFKSSHFLIMPTEAECFGLVFCEANAYGLPVLATRTGGIPTIVKDNLNGILFQLQDPSTSYSSFIANLWSKKEQYNTLSEQSFIQFQNRLNWDVAGQIVTEHLTESLH